MKDSDKTNPSNELSVDCPNCKAVVIWNDKAPHRPFCSQRCKDGDFIGWANETKIIAGSAVYEDIFSDEIEGGY